LWIIGHLINLFENHVSEHYKIVILGGGTAGWMAAAALSHFLKPTQFSVCLIESDEIGTIGVGEATLPHIRQFNQSLGIDEDDFIRATGATFKLAIEFPGWGNQNSSYFHPFGQSGEPINGIDFHHYWLSLNQQSSTPFDHYSLAVMLARNNKFARPTAEPNKLSSSFAYAYHLDATLYAAFLSGFSQQRGVTRVEGKVQKVLQHPSGDIAGLQLESGQQINGDFFIDCSGFRSLILGQTLGVAYENWQQWLLCDSAIAVASESMDDKPPYTRAAAHQSGWQWRIPLQHRTGNGIVYSQQYMSDTNAQDTLLSNIEQSVNSEPRQLRFTPGKRAVSWHKNCVAIGLSAGFLEPLESTSLYLAQIAIQTLIDCFPGKPVGHIERDNFNRKLNSEYLRCRDFIILHYKATRRNDSPFWQYCQHMAIPESLQQQLEEFNCTGKVSAYRDGLFLPASWYAVLLGQGQLPQFHDSRANSIPTDALITHSNTLLSSLKSVAQNVPHHRQSIMQHPFSSEMKGCGQEKVKYG
jgi:tryptophan 7-halogenase